LNSIDRKHSIDHRLYRQHTKRTGPFAIKDLNLIGRDLATTIIIDNLEENFIQTTPDNGICIKSWIDDLEDKELDYLTPFLKAIVDRGEDVRNVLPVYKTNMEDYLNLF